MKLTARKGLKLGEQPSWAPGAWTPERCDLWNWFVGEFRDRLEAWVWREYLRNECYEHQLPDIKASDVS